MCRFKKYILILLAAGIPQFPFLTGLLHAQVSSGLEPDSAGLLLEKIQIHLSSDIPLKVASPISQFRLVKIDESSTRTIWNLVENQLKHEGFYLARLDSIRTTHLSPPNRVVLHLYVNPGARFLLRTVEWGLTDSLRAGYDSPITDIVAEYLNKPYREVGQEEMFRAIIRLFENSGYPLCKISTIGFQVISQDDSNVFIKLVLQIDTGQAIRIAGMRVPEESDLDVNYLERLFRFQKNEYYRENRIIRYSRLLQKQDFIATVNEPSLIMESDSLYYLYLNFERSPATTFDGIVGYIPPPLNDPAAKGYFTGLFNIGLKNLFGTGRRLDVFWQKPDQYSEDFRVRYREPFLLGLPFHLGATFHRLIRDTTYIEWEYAVNGIFPLNEYLSAMARFYSRQVYPDSLASASLRLPRTSAIHTELGVQWDNRDDVYNPKTGLLFAISFDLGRQKNVGPDYLLAEDSLVTKTAVVKMRSTAGLYLQTFRQQVLALQGNLVVIGHEDQLVRPPDMFWFGGATTLRGYRENQFFAEQAGWLNTEYRFLLSQRSRLFLFCDTGYYYRESPETKQEFLLGFGTGISFPAPLGIIQVDYGLAKGLSFSEGKIHFRIINDL